MLGGRVAWIRLVTEDALASMAARGETDLAAGFAGPVSWRLLGSLFGLGDLSDDRLASWLPHLGRYQARGGDPPGPRRPGVPGGGGGRPGAGPLRGGRRGPRALAEVPGLADEGDVFERDLALLLNAGVATTRASILNAAGVLLDQPATEARVRPAVLLEEEDRDQEPREGEEQLKRDVAAELAGRR